MKIRKRGFAVFSAGLMVAVGLSACASGGGTSGGSAAQSGGTIVLGSLQPLSGPVSYLGTETQAGIKVAIAQINAAGGIKSLGGAKLKLVSADSSSSDVSSATVAMGQLVSQNPSAIIGPTDSTTFLPASTVAEKAKIPVCTSSFTDQITTRGYQYTYELPATASAIATETAEILPKVLPSLGASARKVAILYDATNPAGLGEVTPIAQKLKAQGYQIVYEQGFAEGLTTALPLATKIKASGAQILVDGAADPSDALVINRALSAENLSLPILLPGGGLATSVAYVDTLGKLVDGSFVVAQWVWATKYPTAAQNQLLAQAESQYVAQTGQPFMGQFAGEAYACTWEFAQAMEIAKSSSPAAIQQVLKSTTFTTGGAALMPPGNVRFNSAGLNATAVNVVAEWCNGKPYVVYPAAYAVMQVKSPAACGA
jgi:branched-chain amino acid transport system substrate-binding protein